MAEIKVLSDTLKSGNKLEKTTTLKGRNNANAENAAALFAAMLSGPMYMNSNADSKGQISSIVGQESGMNQNAGNPVQGVQKSSGQGTMLGYGNLLLSLVTQPMLQSHLSVGKEANFEGVMSQRNDAAQSGMTTLTPQGDNPVMTELDKYRQVIADLLNSLSGEITNTSLKVTSSSSESINTQGFSHDMAKILQGWMTSEGAIGGPNTSSQVKENGEIPKGLTGESTIDFAKGNSISSEIIGEKDFSQDIRKIVQGWMTLKDDVEKNNSDKPMSDQGTNENKSPQSVKGNVIGPVVTVAKDIAVPENSQQKSTEGGPSAERDLQNPNSNLGVGVAGNILAPNVADGKTIVLPVWKQVANVFQEQVINKHQVLKELDIQLHPADLGKIQIAMRWENGQLHLQLQATEVGTSQLLQNQLSDLRHTLTSQGVNCGMLQMGQGGEQQNHSHGDQSQRTFKQSLDPNEDEDLRPVTATQSIRDDEINRVNVTA